ncbi:family 43 glycosylhydrolase [Paenibacillus hexagrammi]|uniref:Family 43 glycosylhydrolase n=1 Tax=Paenibacillus hexagrammi TaxID=2908839 RepID=A0ABY3SNT1_9BACL|nr:family 43 glycosylhydrolase [Paenibacillus sp. YPD9-1]UJF35477.1 family 43 glycosylhydrolase [Paenibacillus sp. YPD9-1]
MLPEAVPASYSDGTNGYASVTWEQVDPSQYTNTGNFTVEGTVPGFADKAIANVTVIAPQISSYKPVTTITTPRTMPILPATVTAIYGNGTSEAIPVVWETIASSQYAQPGSFTVKGAVAGSSLPVTANISVTAPNVSTRIGNPLLANIFTADPGALTYRNTFYIYAGHDEAPKTATDFLMNDWHILSSTDMQHWNDNGPAMRYDVFSWATGQAYAGQTIEKNGKWYWYCPVGTASGFAIGVAVADSPMGPWKDAIGTSLINSSTVNGSSLNIDPTIFTDTDGQSYLYWGSYNSVRMVKLNADMISYSGSVITPVGLTRYWEAPYLNKIGDKYYFSYAAGANPATIDYAMSDSPAGPWTYKGTINDVTSSPTNHDAIQYFRGNYYFVYHTSDVSDGFDYQRNVAVDLITVNPDGTLNKVVQTKTGPDLRPLTIISPISPPHPRLTSIRMRPF